MAAQDVASLSDLLHTSSPGERTPTESAPEHAPEHALAEAGSLPSPQEEERLLIEKVRLNRARDALIQRRTRLLAEIEALQVRTRHLLGARKQAAAAAASAAAAETANAPNAPADAAGPLALRPQPDELLVFNVHPSSDWPLRLQLAASMLPHLTVADARESSVADRRRITYTLESAHFCLHVDLEVEAAQLVALQLLPRDDTALLLVSLSCRDVIMRNYVPRAKINLLMYSADSLAALAAQRHDGLRRLARAYRDRAVPSASNAVALAAGADRVVVTWELVLEDAVAGDVKSRVRVDVVLARRLLELSHEATRVVTRLARESSVTAAVETFLRLAYAIEPAP